MCRENRKIVCIIASLQHKHVTRKEMNTVNFNETLNHVAQDLNCMHKIGKRDDLTILNFADAF